MSKDIKNDLVRQTKNEYHRKWQRQNPEKVKKAQERYWERKTIKKFNLMEGADDEIFKTNSR